MSISTGSWTHGTLRSQDLIEAALDCLAYLGRQTSGAVQERAQKMHAKLRAEYDVDYHDEEGEFADPTFSAGDLLDDIVGEIDRALPAGMYYGSTEGDGSDIGIWECESDDCD